jgi:hypothetical protein
MKPILIMVLFSTQVLAGSFHEDPERIFDMKKSMTTMSTITIEYARDVQGRCNDERTSRGNKAFGFAVEACSFWKRVAVLDVCHIIVPRKVTLITLGHEFAHCLFGSWH